MAFSSTPMSSVLIATTFWERSVSSAATRTSAVCVRLARTFATASAPSAALSGKVAPTALRLAVSSAPPATISTTATPASAATHSRGAKKAPAQSMGAPSVRRAFT